MEYDRTLLHIGLEILMKASTFMLVTKLCCHYNVYI